MVFLMEHRLKERKRHASQNGRRILLLAAKFYRNHTPQKLSFDADLEGTEQDALQLTRFSGQNIEKMDKMEYNRGMEVYHFGHFHRR